MTEPRDEAAVTQDTAETEQSDFKPVQDPDGNAKPPVEVQDQNVAASGAGRVPLSSRDAILDAMSNFDEQSRLSADWRDWEDNVHHKWALIHDGRRYPVKEMIRRAAGTSSTNFSGGEESNRYLRSLGFTVHRIRDFPPRQVWWVNQGASYRQEHDLGVIWAPKQGKKGRTNAHWTNLTKVQKDDIIIHYANSALRAVSRARGAYQDAPMHDSLPGETGETDGYMVETDYTEFSSPIALADIPLHLRHGKTGGPFTQQGSVNQGYLYPAPEEILPFLVRRFDVGWPDDLVDDTETPSSRLIKIAPGHGGSAWDDCHTGSYVCVGWDEVGNLLQYDSFESFLESFRAAYGLEYNSHEPKIVEKAQEIWTLRELRAGDRIIANRGVSNILGVGTVTEPGYEWLPDREEMRHIVHVDWRDDEPRDIPRQPYWAFKTVLELPLDFLDQLETVTAASDYKSPSLADITKQIRSIGLRLSDRTLRRYHLSLVTRGFVILSGVSGTGKTWLAEAYASVIGAKHEIVAVAPNWNTNEDLLGYFNPVTERFHDTSFSEFIRKAADTYHLATQSRVEAQPYHLILDEMNLARIEYYFAGFLSAMEVRARHGLANIDLGGDDRLELTPNLYVIGTVNIDETTHGFADKVWDRAQLVELDLPRSEFEAHLRNTQYRDDVLAIWDSVRFVGPFAYRVLDDIAMYVQSAGVIGIPWEEALDEQILQKILPKLKGTNPRVHLSLERLVDILEEKYPLSYQRASQMLERFQEYGFTSYFA